MSNMIRFIRHRSKDVGSGGQLDINILSILHYFGKSSWL